MADHQRQPNGAIGSSPVNQAESDQLRDLLVELVRHLDQKDRELARRIEALEQRSAHEHGPDRGSQASATAKANSRRKTVACGFASLTPKVPRLADRLI